MPFTRCSISDDWKQSVYYATKSGEFKAEECPFGATATQGYRCDVLGTIGDSWVIPDFPCGNDHGNNPFNRHDSATLPTAIVYAAVR